MEGWGLGLQGRGYVKRGGFTGGHGEDKADGEDPSRPGTQAEGSRQAMEMGQASASGRVWAA